MILKKKIFFYTFIGLAVSGIAVYFFFNGLFLIFRVKGNSMEPALEDGSRIFVKRIGKKNILKRFDIVVFKKKENNRLSLLIKRVIGLPNEIIELKNENIKINKKKLIQPFIKKPLKIIKNTINRLKIPSDSLYLIGDNRENSKDSRLFGPVKREDIIGKVLFSLIPFKTVY